ncbi:MAG: chromosomal replication initiator protein DnaA, partial [Pseudomonadota bacterium]|nr:chromosomal replication initiator protein DnaA [Pseudomonadota bacterium]
ALQWRRRLEGGSGRRRRRCDGRATAVCARGRWSRVARGQPCSRRFGGRDHTTVMHGVKRIEELRNSDGQIAEDLELLRRTLEA